MAFLEVLWAGAVASSFGAMLGVAVIASGLLVMIITDAVAHWWNSRHGRSNIRRIRVRRRWDGGVR